jgi:hypothetical protein
MCVVYAYILIDSISEIYAYVLFGDVRVDVYLFIVYCVRPCENIIRLDVFRVIRFKIKVKDV